MSAVDMGTVSTETDEDRSNLAGVCVGGRTGEPELPLDVRRRAGGPAQPAVVVESVLDALPSPTLLIDAGGTVLLANTAWQKATDALGDDRVRIGVDGDYFAMARRLNGDDNTSTLVDQLRELSRGERSSVQADYALELSTGIRWIHLQASRVDQAGQVVVTHTDVTSRVAAERASDWRARHDTLTELPNRAHLHELIDTELQRQDRGPVSVLFLDIDGFKDVNDSLGHDVGDDLLRQVAARLTGSTRAGDTVGRLGGDEFVVLCRDCDTTGAEALADRCRAGIDRPFELGSRLVRLGASIGIATAAASGPTRVRSTVLVRDATSPCTRPRRPAATASGCSPPTCVPPPSTGPPSPPSCATRWRTASWCCTTSRWCTCPRDGAPALRRSSAGSTPAAASSRRPTSCRSPSSTTSWG